MILSWSWRSEWNANNNVCIGLEVFKAFHKRRVRYSSILETNCGKSLCFMIHNSIHGTVNEWKRILYCIQWLYTQNKSIYTSHCSKIYLIHYILFLTIHHLYNLMANEVSYITYPNVSQHQICSSNKQKKSYVRRN